MTVLAERNDNNIEASAFIKSQQKDPLRERVYQYLTRVMSTGGVQHGQAINQDLICKELQVSRAPLRDALIRLESEGVVTIVARKGVYLTPVNEAFLRNAYQVINTLEIECLNEVFDFLTMDHVKELEESNSKQKLFLQQNQATAYHEENMRFHDIFLDLTENALLRRLHTSVANRLHLFCQSACFDDWENQRLSEHERFIAAIKNKNRDAAINILKNEHWSFAQHKDFLERYYV